MELLNEHVLNINNVAMPYIIDLELEHRVRQLYDLKFSYRSITKKLRGSGWSVSVGTVSNMIRCKGKRRQERITGVKIKETRTKLTKKVLQVIRKKMTQTNPSVQTKLACRLGISRETLQRAIKELGLKRKRKLKVDVMTSEQELNRATNACKLYRNHFKGTRTESGNQCMQVVQEPFGCRQISICGNT